MMNKIAPIFFMFFLVLNVHAAAVNGNTDKAADLYKQGNYEEAVKEYEIMLLDGFNNPYVFYNLACSYYQSGNIGKASLNAEKALRLDPRGKHIRALIQTIAKSTKEPQPNTAEFLIMHLGLLFSVNEITVITGVLFVLLSLSFGVYCIRKQKVFLKISILILIVAFLSGLLCFFKLYNQRILTEAVIMTDTAVRNKPSKTEDPAFVVSEGRKIVILSELGKWINIKLLRDGFSGWVDKNTVEKI